MAPGGLLAIYTDGLIERREYPLDEGLSRLVEAVHPASADAACSAVMGAMIGGDRIQDDIALLVLACR
jgi:serine phosphatase RsbU (regulator of sigma subunit)